MRLEGKRIGIGLTGSHHMYQTVFRQIERLIHLKAAVIPVVTYSVLHVDTKHGLAADNIKKLEDLTGQQVISSMTGAERLGPDLPLDCMVAAPLTGNSMSKLANGLTDSPVTMAVKSTIRNQCPVVLGISTNDALGLNGVNLMRLMNSKYVYFIPYGQDNPFEKPNSLVANMDLLVETVETALEFKQLQPVIIPHVYKNVVN